MNVPPRLTTNPKDYRIREGDAVVRAIDIRPEHRGRIFEARDDKGAGILGPLLDVTSFHLDGQSIVRFQDVAQGLLADFDAVLLLRPEGTTVEALKAEE